MTTAGTSGGHPAGPHTHASLGRDTDRRALAGALAVIAAFLVLEVAAGFFAHSLALVTDAAHMLTDAGALLLALGAIAVAARPARPAYTFGLRRVELVSAHVNALMLVGLGAVLAVEGVVRLVHPAAVDGPLVVAVAVVGVVVNAVATLLLRRADRGRLDVAGAYAHLLTDLYAFAGTAVAGVVVWTTGFDRADPIAALVVAVIMLRSGVRILLASGRVFLDAAPAGVEPERVGTALAGRPGVVEVHDLHVWEVTSGYPAMSAHVLVAEHGDCHAVRHDLEQVLDRDFGIAHTTLQVDHVADSCADPHGTAHRPPA